MMKIIKAVRFCIMQLRLGCEMADLLTACTCGQYPRGGQDLNMQEDSIVHVCSLSSVGESWWQKFNYKSPNIAVNLKSWRCVQRSMSSECPMPHSHKNTNICYCFSLVVVLKCPNSVFLHWNMFMPSSESKANLCRYWSKFDRRIFFVYSCFSCEFDLNFICSIQHEYVIVH